MLKACLFDLDGTLLNTLISLRHFMNKTILSKGIAEISEDETKAFVGWGAKTLVRNVLLSRGYEFDNENTNKLFEQIHEKFLLDYNSHPLYLTEPYTGICDAVSALTKKGIKLAVISNKPDPITKQLVESFFPDSFLVVDGASEKFPLKPNPEWPLDVCKRLGVLPSEVAYVGDTAIDMQTAKNFGAGVSIGVLWGFRNETELVASGADFVVSHPEEILNIIDKTN